MKAPQVHSTSLKLKLLLKILELQNQLLLQC